MKWFQHDSNASHDAKIKKLIFRHGAEGYAVYFHCLELIASDLTQSNINFELEHDAEIIADNLKIKGDQNKAGIDKVNNILKTIIQLGLFTIENNRVFCFKMASRLDNVVSRNPEINKIKYKFGLLESNPDQFIYIIKGKDYFKIGKTKNINRRMKEFKVSIPYSIKLNNLIKVSDMTEAEKYIHKICERSRVEGEWFSLSEKDINLIIDVLKKKFNGHTEDIRITDVTHDQNKAEYNTIHDNKREYINAEKVWNQVYRIAQDGGHGYNKLNSNIKEIINSIGGITKLRQSNEFQANKMKTEFFNKVCKKNA